MTEVAKLKKKKKKKQSTCAAVEGSIVPVGGISLLRFTKNFNEIKPLNKDQAIGVAIVKRVLKVPCMLALMPQH